MLSFIFRSKKAALPKAAITSTKTPTGAGGKKPLLTQKAPQPKLSGFANANANAN